MSKREGEEEKVQPPSQAQQLEKKDAGLPASPPVKIMQIPSPARQRRTSLVITPAAIQLDFNPPGQCRVALESQRPSLDMPPQDVCVTEPGRDCQATRPEDVKVSDERTHEEELSTCLDRIRLLIEELEQSAANT